MKYKKRLIILTALLVLLSVPAVRAAPLSQVNDVAREFICNCGCNKMLPNCDMSCGKELKSVIAKKIDSGMNKEQIVNYMLKNYNKQILSAPPMKGFDWSAWITPYIAIAMGGGLILLVIGAWVRTTQKGEMAMEEMRVNKEIDNVGPRPSRRTRREQQKKKIDDEKYKDKLDEELKDFDW